MYSKGFRFKKTELGKFTDVEQITLLLKNKCRIMGLTDGSFSLIDIIYTILKKIGKSDVVVSTWSAGIKDVNNVFWMIENDLLNSFKIITDRSYKSRQAKYSIELDKLFGEQNVNCANSHAKFVLISNDEYKITVNTSMNLNANKTVENFEINDCQDVYNLYNEYCKNIFFKNPHRDDSKTNTNLINKEYFQEVQQKDDKISQNGFNW